MELPRIAAAGRAVKRRGGRTHVFDGQRVGPKPGRRVFWFSLTPTGLVALLTLLLVVAEATGRHASGDSFLGRAVNFLYSLVNTSAIVGYRDLAPRGLVGKVFASFLALLGVVSGMLVTAVMASVFTAKQLADTAKKPSGGGSQSAPTPSKQTPLHWVLVCIARPFRSAMESFAGLKREVWKEGIPRLSAVVLSVMVFAAFVVGLVEVIFGSESQRANFANPVNALYWAVVTMATVGYGDLAPQTMVGRFLTSVFILVGVVTISIFTATLASVFTAKRIKEGRGLEKVKVKGHVVVCGTGRHLDTIIRYLTRAGIARKQPIVLVNSLTEEAMNEILYRYSHLDIQHVHGDFTQESVLRRANIEDAVAAIIQAGDDTQDRSRADNRTLQAALAIKALNHDIKVIAEALEPENEAHLRRANVDDVIVSGEFSGYLLGACTVSPGLDVALRELLSVEVRNDIIRNPIPESFRGKTFKELSEWFRQREAMLIGIIVEQKVLNLDEMLQDDFSSIDRFIRSTFSAAGKELVAQGKGRTEVVVNPPDDRVIGPDDAAIIIAPRVIPVTEA
ncbi:MAG TPA: ion channel [Candidatus Latescibacteria bacterium]|nr:ion channel [Candidatus Latescibacterota bacterium]